MWRLGRWSDLGCRGDELARVSELLGPGGAAISEQTVVPDAVDDMLAAETLADTEDSVRPVRPGDDVGDDLAETACAAAPQRRLLASRRSSPRPLSGQISGFPRALYVPAHQVGLALPRALGRLLRTLPVPPHTLAGLLLDGLGRWLEETQRATDRAQFAL